jgi:hypothetical protein
MLHFFQAVASYFVFGEATQDALWLTGDEKTTLCTLTSQFFKFDRSFHDDDRHYIDFERRCLRLHNQS